MTKHSQFKTRFSPSPTGLMHLGNLRTALFNVLLAQSLAARGMTGHFLLRIEDTDLVRSKTEFTDKLKADLKWLGLDWQEGPDVGGDHAPYFQSERVSIYNKYYQQLLDQGDAYHCFCSEQALSLIRKEQLMTGKPPRYAGTCRHLTQEQIEKKRASGIIPTLRFKIPDNTEIRFEDLIQGLKVFKADDIGDFIIQKQDQSASFMFCNAVDDALMGVTHAVRGEDHLTNTPRQMLILQALKLPIAHYGHMPLIVGDDGKPLSKRNGSMSVEELREQGYWPQAILNYLSRLGHHYPEEKLMPAEELGKAFALEHIGRSPARFDLHQLHHWQKEVVLKEEKTHLWNWMKNAVGTLLPHDKQDLFIDTVRENIIFPQDAAAWAVSVFGPLTVQPEDMASLKEAGKTFFEVAASAVEEKGINAAYVIECLKTQTGKKGKGLFLPIRLALSGRHDGPELAKLFNLLGQAQVIDRFRQAGNLC